MLKIGEHRINEDYIMTISVDRRSIPTVTLWMAHTPPDADTWIDLKGEDAEAFLAWYDDEAIDVVEWYKAHQKMEAVNAGIAKYRKELDDRDRGAVQ